MTESVKYDFHDQGVTGFSLHQKSIRLDLERFDDAAKTYVPSSVIFEDVDDIVVDGYPSATVAAIHDDGEVVHFGIADGKATLIIQWNDFKNKKNSTKSYTFKFRQMDIKTG